jgi:hypothetical protein
MNLGDDMSRNADPKNTGDSMRRLVSLDSSGIDSMVLRDAKNDQPG